MKILIINGPNLNLLGIREPGIYGSGTYNELCSYIKDAASAMEIETAFYQSNHEGAIIDEIHKAMGIYDGIVINPGAYTHYSYAILDALKAVKIPAVEVHISDIHSRESFRRVSVTAAGCIGQISGHGFKGYCEALEMLNSYRG